MDDRIDDPATRDQAREIIKELRGLPEEGETVLIIYPDGSFLKTKIRSIEGKTYSDILCFNLTESDRFLIERGNKWTSCTINKSNARPTKVPVKVISSHSIAAIHEWLNK